MALTGKGLDEVYKDLLELDNSNSGVPATSTATIKDGFGTSTSLGISEDKTAIKPNNNDTTNLFTVEDKAGNDILVVDSSNNLVKVNTAQNYAITKYKIFTALQLNGVANTWYSLPFGNGDADTTATLGTASTPSDTHTATYKDVLLYWYLHDNITLDAIKVFHMGDDSASTDSLSYAIKSYALDTSGAGAGDLSSGSLHAVSTSQTIDNADLDQHTLSIATADINAGRVVLACVRAGSTINNDISTQMSIKYHIR